ncbi:hypothetical protein CANINC_004479 [Pichia inconspicua]|uniref:Uncharacterized protein n=1 Tax=Pichia inconspicua TaxID=52247 RepID=A0A4T0WWK7_9ASCO|nr:hypothetical protein CANINC_004479 [[Candida] inconspicua]
MKFSILALTFASVAFADRVVTQIGDGQIQVPTTERPAPPAPTTEKPAPPAPTTEKPAPPAPTTEKPAPPKPTTHAPVPPKNETEVPDFPNAAPRAVVGGGLAAIAGLAVLL